MRTASDVFRTASPADADALTALERDTNLVALAHVFPGVPYPEAEVRARWAALLEDPRIRVEVTGPAERLDVYLAWDDERLRHLGVRPERWGQGLARAAVRRAHRLVSEDRQVDDRQAPVAERQRHRTGIVRQWSERRERRAALIRNRRRRRSAPVAQSACLPAGARTRD